jgi:hypothetical protein
VSDLQDTLDAIDTLAVHCCGYCDEPLTTTGPSPDFCGDYCQQRWTARQAEVAELIGYREPVELAAHVGNLVELSNPETTPPCSCLMCSPRDLGPLGVTLNAEQAQRAGVWWAPGLPDTPSGATLADYQRTLDDVVAQVARQATIPPELLSGFGSAGSLSRYVRYHLGLPDDAEPETPLRIIDFGGGS